MRFLWINCIWLHKNGVRMRFLCLTRPLSENWKMITKSLRTKPKPLTSRKPSLVLLHTQRDYRKFWIINFASQWHHLQLRLVQQMLAMTTNLMHEAPVAIFFAISFANFAGLVASGILISMILFFRIIFSFCVVDDHKTNIFVCCMHSHTQACRAIKKSATVMMMNYLSKKPRDEKFCSLLHLRTSSRREREWCRCDLPRTVHVFSRRCATRWCRCINEVSRLSKSSGNLLSRQRLRILLPLNPVDRGEFQIDFIVAPGILHSRKASFLSRQLRSTINAECCVRDVNHP